MKTYRSGASHRALLAIATGWGLWAMPAQAQTTEDQAAAKNAAEAAQPSPDEGAIIVTALRRGMNIQETPISISAIGGEDLANSGVKDISNLAASTPSLQLVDGGPSYRRVVIRGIQSAGEATVGTYYDEVAVTGVVGAAADAGGSTPELRLFDVERVEVLRGPQGTLYGAGSMGGTLRVIYKKPVNRFEGGFDGTISSVAHGEMGFGANAMLNVPIADDKAAIRGVAYYNRQGGYIDNVPLGIEDINRTKSYAGRLQLRLRPVDDLTIDFAAHLNKTTSDTPSWTKDAGRYKSDNLIRNPISDRVNLYSMTAEWSGEPIKVTGVVSYMDRHMESASDTSRYMRSFRTEARCRSIYNANVACDAARLADYYAFVDGLSPSGLYPQQDMKAWTGELRFGSNTPGPVQWTVGGFYSNRKTDVFNPMYIFDPVTGYPLEPKKIGTGRYIDDELSQLAGFGDVSWDITDQLNFTVGARYFTYQREITGETPYPLILLGARLTPPTTVKAVDSGWVFKFNGSYKITPDVMIYGEASQGFRPGGVNQVLGLPSELGPYSSDSLWNYEIGLKTDLFDRKVQFNIDGFLIDWKDMQTSAMTLNRAFGFITNAGAARIKGIEADMTARPVQGLTLQANASLMSAKLVENQTNALVLAPGLKGDRIPYIPQFTAAASAQYDFPLSETLGGMMRVDFRHSGSYHSSFRPTDVYDRKTDSYELVNVRAGVEGEDKKWGAYLFVTNLFDATAITRTSSSGIGLGRTVVTSAGPRTIGLNLRYGF